ncbi:hypothetical protein [Hoeflea poritis]|uniref:Uncharacterized protein n=1 Tax=Hoeflea poritis TaxID=2993659 RepID=A0ABT4VMN7_9HYPH|nr:hypothetical protein [Hoeflea poritis]MDA4845988.1 hypothetical protein [Hoeflea poritis]
MTDEDDDDLAELEVAKSIHSFVCDNCNNVHITIIDFEGDPFADIELSAADAAAFANQLMMQAQAAIMRETRTGDGRNKLH